MDSTQWNHSLQDKKCEISTPNKNCFANLKNLHTSTPLSNKQVSDITNLNRKRTFSEMENLIEENLSDPVGDGYESFDEEQLPENLDKKNSFEITCDELKLTNTLIQETIMFIEKSEQVTIKEIIDDGNNFVYNQTELLKNELSELISQKNKLEMTIKEQASMYVKCPNEVLDKTFFNDTVLSHNNFTLKKNDTNTSHSNDETIVANFSNKSTSSSHLAFNNSFGDNTVISVNNDALITLSETFDTSVERTLTNLHSNKNTENSNLDDKNVIDEKLLETLNPNLESKNIYEKSYDVESNKAKTLSQIEHITYNSEKGDLQATQVKEDYPVTNNACAKQIKSYEKSLNEKINNEIKIHSSTPAIVVLKNEINNISLNNHDIIDNSQFNKISLNTNEKNQETDFSNEILQLNASTTTLSCTKLLENKNNFTSKSEVVKPNFEENTLQTCKFNYDEIKSNLRNDLENQNDNILFINSILSMNHNILNRFSDIRLMSSLYTENQILKENNNLNSISKSLLDILQIGNLCEKVISLNGKHYDKDNLKEYSQALLADCEILVNNVRHNTAKLTDYITEEEKDLLRKDALFLYEIIHAIHYKTTFKRVRVPYISLDLKENEDNTNLNWNALKLLETDEERYKIVRKRWLNLNIPDPHANLTHRLNGNLINIFLSKYNYNKTRTVPFKELFDSKAKNIQYQKENLLLKLNLQEDSEINQLFLRHAEEHQNIDRRNFKCLYDKQMKETRILKERFGNERRKLLRDTQSKLDLLLFGMLSAHNFLNFYEGLSYQSALLISESDLKEDLEVDEMISGYAEFYANA